MAYQKPSVSINEQTAQQYVSQFLIASAGPDGTVQAVTPGVYNDNGGGIDWQYETTCPQKMMTVCQIRGFNLNALGNGTIFPSFLAARDMVTDFGLSREIKLKPFDLAPDQRTGISRQAPPKTNERWRLRLTNGAIANNWASVKYACLFSRAVRTARTETEV